MGEWDSKAFTYYIEFLSTNFFTLLHILRTGFILYSYTLYMSIIKVREEGILWKQRTVQLFLFLIYLALQLFAKTADSKLATNV